MGPPTPTSPPGPPVRDPTHEASLAHARHLILDYGWNATAYQILNPGIERWFDPAGDAVVGYVTYGGYRMVAGSPVCASARLGAVVERFEREAAGQRQRVCYFAADERLAAVLDESRPRPRLYLGAQPVWDPREWPRILTRKASLRAQLHRASNKGVVVEEWSAEEARRHPELERCRQEWLATRGLPPLRFLVESKTLGRLWDRRIFVARLEGRSVGFLVATPVPRRMGYLIEQNIRGCDAPNGTTELLLDAAMRAAADGGSCFVTLGLCPLSRRSGLEDPKSQPLWIRLLTGWMRAHGRRFYNFDGLDAYKAKFLPMSWEPIYAVTSDRRIGPRTLWAITGAFGRMSPLALAARALGRALKQEATWLEQRLRRSAAPAEGP
ncbi:MAG: DUF2156 domain-containing protein [Acidobacteria bacterium]|nr:DUF2156 domain-containing protein [Acidobacteriota bacterium]